MATASVQQLRALAATVSSDCAVLAVRGEPAWTGPELIDVGQRPMRVKACASPLAVRAAVTDAESAGTGELLAVITPCSDHDLGPDLLARLAKHRVLIVDPYAAVLGLFRAELLEPSLARADRWLIDELIALAPPGGWQFEGVAGGVLDRDTAFRVWHDCRLPGIKPPDTLEEVLAVASTTAVGQALSALSSTQRAKLAERWAQGVAPVGLIVDLAATERPSDVVALGVIAGVLHAPTDDPHLARQQRDARIRFEPLLGRDRLTAASAAAWAEAAMSLVVDDEMPTPFHDRAQTLLDERSAGGLAVLSDALPAGYDLRLTRLGRGVADNDADAAATELTWLARHRLAGTRQRRTATAEAAVRAVRRVHPPTVGPSFADAVRAYATDGAWVDEVRRLLADGDQLASVASAFGELCRRLDDERRLTDASFAQLLVSWTQNAPPDDDEIVPVERILDQVVAPIAQIAPVLVIVSDGTSLAVANELLREIHREGWTQAAPIGRDRPPTGVAMLPTVTEVSRTSLLAGRHIEGGQPEERQGFSQHAALRAASSTTRPPVLFHKGQLVGASGWALAEEVQRQIADPDQRVVGVVLNAVDDHLSRGQQVQVTWSLETFRPLGALLDAAREAGRVVVLTADHGHVIHGEGAVSRPAGSGGGERWRTPPPASLGDEVEVSGPRVLKGGRVVLPADERVRYGGHKHGYHGGATPQEVLVPIAVLARTLPDGWQRLPPSAPAWWTGATSLPAQVAAQPAPSAPAAVGQPSLFEPAAEEETTPPASWVASFVASDAFNTRLTNTRLPRPIASQRVAGYLDAIIANGGTVTLEALALRVNEPADQLRMALTLVQRVINVDGAEVLAVRADGSVQTVVVNVALLATQFGFDVP